MPSRVYLHVGVPKSGTTYLQSRLWANRRELRRHGIVYPAGRFGDPRGQYWAALEVTGTDHGVDPGRVRGAWQRLVRRARRSRGTVVLSHEVLARADEAQVARVLADLAATGAEVHLVLTVRDLARELTSGWQETLKFGGRLTFADFLARARDERPGFTRSFDPVRVLSVWGKDLPAERVHVVTAPPAGAGPEVLWGRFLATLGGRPEWARRPAAGGNESVGVPEAQLLRRLNGRLGKDARRGGAYSPLIDGVVVRDALAPRDTSRIMLGPADHPWVADRSAGWIDWLRARGAQVHGDLDDLRPAAPPDDWADPDAPVPGRVAAAAVDAVEVLLAEAQARHRPFRRRLRTATARITGGRRDVEGR